MYFILCIVSHSDFISVESLGVHFPSTILSSFSLGIFLTFSALTCSLFVSVIVFGVTSAMLKFL